MRCDQQTALHYLDVQARVCHTAVVCDLQPPGMGTSQGFSKRSRDQAAISNSHRGQGPVAHCDQQTAVFIVIVGALRMPSSDCGDDPGATCITWYGEVQGRSHLSQGSGDQAASCDSHRRQRAVTRCDQQAATPPRIWSLAQKQYPSSIACCADPA